MKRFLRLALTAAASILLPAALADAPVTPAAAAVPSAVYIRPLTAGMDRHVGVQGGLGYGAPVNTLTGNPLVWDMTVVSTYQGFQVVTLAVIGTPLCLGKVPTPATSTAVVLYGCDNGPYQRWLLQRTSTYGEAKVYYFRSFVQGVPGDCLKVNPTGPSSVGACVPHFDEYAVFVI
ncbi:hypothetical protein [Planotetraspora kaengkrachanensis]|uniref:Ricin B lectin domain-containing protein n=1 Tax=Planotetraspora kaengkrachanensis TaxID=575193 RepID=A0A8J3M679_9ACTN|nr:hypothetical protein [Planotetraspora kaengkrachanensis]GIG80076.1 hypothetical protein Pka01_32030 [Planotetraspora kaengkrachanensis]